MGKRKRKSKYTEQEVKKKDKATLDKNDIEEKMVEWKTYSFYNYSKR